MSVPSEKALCHCVHVVPETVIVVTPERSAMAYLRIDFTPPSEYISHR